MHPVNIEQFWIDNAIAAKDPFGSHIPQAAMHIGLGYYSMFDELGLPMDMLKLDQDFDFARSCAKRYNELAKSIIGKSVLDENQYDPARKILPTIPLVGELFGCKNVWQSESWWLMESAHNPSELSAVLDRVDKLDLPSAIIPENWDQAVQAYRNYHGHGPVLGGALRGPITLATSIYGPENFIFLLQDEPQLAQRFRDTLQRVILEYFTILRDRMSDPQQVQPGFSFFDDNCALMTPDMYDFFGRPILQAVYDKFAPNPKDTRYQHSDSDMEHLLPLLASTGMNRVNFGPNVRFKSIRAAMPNAVVEGTMAPFTLMRNNEPAIEMEVRRDLDESRPTRGLVVATAGSVNDGTRLTSVRLIMSLIQRYGRY